jgi:hypothetical protein
MVGTIGSGKTNARSRRLVGDYPRLPVRAIPKWGTVTLTWPQKLASALHARVTRTRADLVVIETGGIETEITLQQWAMPTVKFRQRGIRWRFVCGRCGASRDALHWLPGEGWGCRGKNCLVPDGVGYACRYRQRYCPAIRRRARLLRKLARVPPQSLKARALRAQIEQQESLMLAHLQRVNRDVTKRRQRYGRRVDISERAG